MGTNESKFSNPRENALDRTRIGANLIETTYQDSDNDQEDENLVENETNSLLKGNNLTDNKIKFHDVCGKNVCLKSNKKIAERSENSFCDAIVFSNRPIGVYERVYVKILKLSSSWNGMLRFGFTCVNPETHIKDNSSNQKEELTYLTEDDDIQEAYLYDLPKYVYPDLTNKRGYWANAMGQNSIKENDILYFYVNSYGEIHYGINDTYKGQFLNGINVYSKPQQAQPLWAIFDIYGNTLSLELLNNKLDLNNNDSNSEQTSIQTISSSVTNNFRTLLTISAGSESGSLGTSSYTNSSSISTQSSLSSTTSSNSSSVTSSNMVTMIPNQTVVLRKNINSNLNNNQRISTEKNFDKLLISHRRLCVDNHLNETLSTSILERHSAQINQEIEILHNKIKNFYESIPILLHENEPNNSNKFINNIHGKNVNILKPDYLIAYRESSFSQAHNKLTINHKKDPTRNCYVFLDKPIEKEKSFCLQIVGIDQSPNESKMSLGIGCTNFNPYKLNPNTDLPDDADELLDRPEYWIVFKNLFNTDIIAKKHHVSLADELCFCLDEKNGNLKFSINGSVITNCLFSVDLTQNLWFFFDLCGKINAVRLIKPCQTNTQAKSTLSSENSSTQRTRPNSALIDYYKSQLLPEPEANEENFSKSKKEKAKRNSNQEECRICLDAPIECVFYSCGHMCLCWKCASTLKKQAKKSSQSSDQQIYSKKSKNPICPICRVEIIDIIRFYKS